MKRHFAAAILAPLVIGGAAAEQADREFFLVPEGVYTVGSPESEDWREADETLRTVRVAAFYIGVTEVTQAEYERVMHRNPSAFKGGDNPVDSVTFLDAAEYCNARSRLEGLAECYRISDGRAAPVKNADGYRLPSEIEWEIACRAGTRTPFNLEKSIDSGDANFYGHYPYQIEQNYFSQGKLEAKPGQYRGRTVPVKSFAPNRWGLYDMHGNVAEWTGDYYGGSDYLRVMKGGGWNDFAKHLRSAYRSAVPEDDNFSSRGFRIARNGK